MHVAIIEDNENIAEQIAGLLKKEDWAIDFFHSSTDFGHTDLTQYDVIISDLSLQPIDGRQLLRILSEKTKAELLLMNDGKFDEEDLHNKAIRGLIDKTNPLDVMDKLRYTDIKLRIQKLASEESINLNSFLSDTPYTIQDMGKKILIEISDIGVEPVNELKEYLEKAKKDVIISFADRALMSVHLGFIASFYRILNKNGMKLYYWNKFRSTFITDLFDSCKLSKIVPIVDDYKDLT